MKKRSVKVVAGIMALMVTMFPIENLICPVSVLAEQTDTANSSESKFDVREFYDRLQEEEENQVITSLVFCNEDYEGLPKGDDIYRVSNGVFYVVAESGKKVEVPEECYEILESGVYVEEETIKSVDLRGLDTSNTDNVEIVMDSIGFTNLETVYCPDEETFEYLGEYMKKMTELEVNLGEFVAGGAIEITKGDGTVTEVVRNGIKFYCTGEYAEVKGFTKGVPDEIIIPNEVDGLKVVSIDEKAFENSTISNVKIEANVEKIPVSCFANCRFLERVVIADGVKSICEKAFANCGMMSEIVISATVTEIADNAFEYSKSVVISAPVGSYAIDYADKNNIKYVKESTTTSETTADTIETTVTTSETTADTIETTVTTSETTAGTTETTVTASETTASTTETTITTSETTASTTETTITASETIASTTETTVITSETTVSTTETTITTSETTVTITDTEATP